MAIETKGANTISVFVPAVNCVFFYFINAQMPFLFEGANLTYRANT